MHGLQQWGNKHKNFGPSSTVNDKILLAGKPRHEPQLTSSVIQCALNLMNFGIATMIGKLRLLQRFNTQILFIIHVPRVGLLMSFPSPGSHSEFTKLHLRVRARSIIA
jgi:hypothetical protein